jgi:hypothetical protein
MANNTKKVQKICKVKACSAPYTTSVQGAGNSRWCPDCRRKKRAAQLKITRENDREYRLQMAEERKRAGHDKGMHRLDNVILYDPDPYSGFFRGARFTHKDIRDMLNDGFLSIGTVIEKRTGKFKVMPKQTRRETGLLKLVKMEF